MKLYRKIYFCLIIIRNETSTYTVCKISFITYFVLNIFELKFFENLKCSLFESKNYT